MDILKRLIPGLAVIVAAIMGYSYAVYSSVPQIPTALPDLPASMQPAPEPNPPPEPVAQCPLPPPSPSVAQLEQAAYTFAEGFEKLGLMQADVKAIAGEIKAIRERLDKPPAGWTAVVTPAVSKPRPRQTTHSWLAEVLR